MVIDQKSLILFLCNVCTDDVTGSWLLKGNAVELDGQRHMRIKDVGMKLDIGDMKIYATNMINGSPELSKYLLTGGFVWFVCQKTRFDVKRRESQ